MRDGNRATETADVLLVEDNPGDVRLTQEAFEEGEIDSTLHVVTDGIEALDFLFQRADFADAPRPDLVLLDLNLPQKDGGEVLKAIRDDLEMRCVPMVVLTSSEAREDIVKSYTNGANACITKPVDPHDFIDVVVAVQRFWLSVVTIPRFDG